MFGARDTGYSGGVDTGDIGHSLRLRSAASAYLSRTFGTPTSANVWTWSGWVKRGNLGASVEFTPLSTNSGTSYEFIAFSTDQIFWVCRNNTGSIFKQTYTTGAFRDPSSHMHVLVRKTASLTVEIYVNGVLQTTGTGSAGSPASVEIMNTALSHRIGYAHFSGLYTDGHLSRVCFIDGTALTPSSFGYLSTEINEWVTKSQSAVKAVVDAGGTNSFMLDFDNATSLTTLGYDKSSKGNNWTLNNVSLTAGVNYDWMLDVPGNSYATLNPLRIYSTSAPVDGNLKGGPSGAVVEGVCTFPATYKIYAEYTIGMAPSGAYPAVGLIDANCATNQVVGRDPTYKSWAYQCGNGQVYKDAVAGSTYTACSNGDVMMIAFDPSSRKVWVGRNGTWFNSGNPDAGTGHLDTLSAETYFFASSHNGTAGNWNFGQRGFSYAPASYNASTFKALCQANLPDGETITTSGSFTGNLNADGPYIDIKGVPLAMSINGNAVTFGTHADKTAFGFKVRSSSSSYNNTGSNTYSITSNGPKRKYALAQANP